MQYYRIKNYGKLNHYKFEKQSQIWIKLYKNIVMSRDWVSLKDHQKVWMIALLCCANQHGCVEKDERMLQLRANLRRKPDLRKLQEIGFIELIDSNDGGRSSILLESHYADRLIDRKIDRSIDEEQQVDMKRQSQIRKAKLVVETLDRMKNI